MWKRYCQTTRLRPSQLIVHQRSSISCNPSCNFPIQISAVFVVLNVKEIKDNMGFFFLTLCNIHLELIVTYLTPFQRVIALECYCRVM